MRHSKVLPPESIATLFDSHTRGDLRTPSAVRGVVKRGHTPAQGLLADCAARYARITLFSVRRLLLHAPYVARHSEYPPLEMNGVRVLLVEDAELIGELMHDMFRDAGATVVAQAQSAPAALRILHNHPVDVVCLDILLGYQPSFALADWLVLRGIPFVFVTACDPGIVPERHRHQLLVDKDHIPYLLIPACRAALAHARLRMPVAINPAGARHPPGGRP
jgi:CheY-like chemotaxis protein